MYRIRANQIVEDIRSGVSDEELKKKYGLSLRGLQRALKTLTLEKAVSHGEMYKRSSAYRSIVEILDSRNAPRIYVPIAIRVFNVETSQRGFVRDVSETGLKVAGISANVGDIVSLSLPLKELVTAEPIEFQAVCRWAKKEGRIKRYTVCGFEISSLSEGAKRGYEELLDVFKYQENMRVSAVSSPLDLQELVKSATAMSDEVEGPKFSGQVDGVDILEFIQFLMLSGKKTRVDINSDSGDECQLHLEDGRIVQATYGEKNGVEAFFECMKLNSGSFRARPCNETIEKSIKEPGDFLIFEAARRRDIMACE